MQFPPAGLQLRLDLLRLDAGDPFGGLRQGGGLPVRSVHFLLGSRLPRLELFQGGAAGGLVLLLHRGVLGFGGGPDLLPGGRVLGFGRRPLGLMRGR